MGTSTAISQSPVSHRASGWCGRRWRVLLACLPLFLPMQSLQAAPEITQWYTAKGARVLYVNAPDLPMVDIRVVFNAGSARDGGLPGTARFVSNLLNQGAGDWNADEIAERLDSVGAELRRGALRDMAWVSLRSLTDRSLLDTAVETMRQVIARPTFRKPDMERVRRNMLTDLQLQKESPSDTASKAFFKAVYGKHPYAYPVEGTSEALQQVKRSDLARFHQRFYVASNAVVSIVGAVDRKQAEGLVARVTGLLPAGDAAGELPAVPKLQQARRVDIPFQSAQAHVRVGQPGIRRGDPDYFALYTGNYILGGSGLVSRLSEEIRENRGLSYSVYSYFSPMGRKGPFLMGLQTRTSQTREAIDLLGETLRRFVTEGPTPEELDAAIRGITGGFALRLDTNRKLVEYLTVIGFYDLPLDYLETFPEKIKAVTRKQVLEAFKRHLHPDRMVTVVVGDTAGE